MDLEHRIDALRELIARAQAERDALRTTATEERYLESYVIARALEIQLEELLCQPRA